MKPDLVVMDWGIGGLSVYNEIRKLMPDVSILYFSDSGHQPYGRTPKAKLKARLRELILGFSADGTRHFVVACNAASTVLPELEREFTLQGLEVAGVIEHGVALIQKSRAENVAVIGGRRTILSRHFSRPFKNRRGTVTGRIAQPLSALIERGDIRGPRLIKALNEILAPIKNCEALVLACTHYPAVAPQIQKLLPNVKLLDPAAATAKHVQRKWKFKRGPGGRQVFMTSGDAGVMVRAARLAFGTRIAKVIEV